MQIPILSLLIMGSLSQQICPKSDQQKQDCGFFGITKGQCEEKGCCWKSGIAIGVPWCFKMVQSDAIESNGSTVAITSTINVDSIVSTSSATAISKVTQKTTTKRITGTLKETQTEPTATESSLKSQNSETQQTGLSGGLIACIVIFAFLAVFGIGTLIYSKVGGHHDSSKLSLAPKDTINRQNEPSAIETQLPLPPPPQPVVAEQQFDSFVSYAGTTSGYYPPITQYQFQPNGYDGNPTGEYYPDMLQPQPQYYPDQQSQLYYNNTQGQQAGYYGHPLQQVGYIQQEEQDIVDSNIGSISK